VLQREPNNFAALSNRGVALRDRGRFEDALASFERALALRPDVAGIRCNRAAALHQLGRTREALADYASVLRALPDFAIAHRGLFEVFAEATPAADAIDPELEALLVRATREPWGRPQSLAALLIAVVQRRPAYAEMFADAIAPVGDALEAASGDAVLLALLEHCLVTDPSLEGVLARMRANLLRRAAQDSSARKASPRLELHCALARNAFLAGYLDVPGPEEREVLAQLRQRLQDDPSPSAAWIAACASYAPLDADPQSDLLLARAWPEPVQRLLRQQLREPAEERRLAATVTSLTAIASPTPDEDATQPGGHAYPRWVALPAQVESLSLATYLSLRLPGVAPDRFPHLTRVAALDAGCGTGEHPIEIAHGVRDVEMLAIDLSRARLAYAKRMAQPLKLGNLRFAQADLLAIGAGLRFDLIECSGALHHLSDPQRGLATLARHLRSGGVMRLGLYSALGRRHLDAARDFVAARGFGADDAGVRACRQEILRQSEGSPLRGVTRFGAFYCLDACRDLLFHEREHRYDLEAIGDALAANALEFLGFELDSAARHAFRRMFPDPARLRDLEAWGFFEERHPEAFAGMYRLWVRKPDE
jgi:SAM-dependent methyltransferase